MTNKSLKQIVGEDFKKKFEKEICQELPSKVPSIEDLIEKVKPKVSGEEMKRLDEIAYNAYIITQHLERMDSPPKEFDPSRTPFSHGRDKVLDEINVLKNTASLALKYAGPGCSEYHKGDPGYPYWVASGILDEADPEMSLELKIEGWHAQGSFSFDYRTYWENIICLKDLSKFPKMLQLANNRLASFLDDEDLASLRLALLEEESIFTSHEYCNAIGNANIKNLPVAAKAYRKARNLQGLENAFNHSLKVFASPTEDGNVVPTEDMHLMISDLLSKTYDNFELAGSSGLGKGRGWENYFKLGTAIKHNVPTYNRGPLIYEGRLAEKLEEDIFFVGVFATGDMDTYHTLVLSTDSGWRIGIERTRAYSPSCELYPIRLVNLDAKKNGDKHTATISYRVGGHDGELYTKKFELDERDRSLRLKLSEEDLDTKELLYWK